MIDFCNAEWARRLEGIERIIAEFIPHRDNEYIKPLARAIIAHLTKQEKKNEICSC